MEIHIKFSIFSIKNIFVRFMFFFIAIFHYFSIIGKATVFPLLATAFAFLLSSAVGTIFVAIEWIRSHRKWGTGMMMVVPDGPSLDGGLLVGIPMTPSNLTDPTKGAYIPGYSP